MINFHLKRNNLTLVMNFRPEGFNHPVKELDTVNTGYRMVNRMLEAGILPPPP